MKTWSKLAAVLTVVALLCAVQTVEAAKVKPLRGQVVKVDGTNLVIKTGKRGEQKEVTVATDTKTAVMIEGKPAKLADLKAGQKVNIMMADETGAGPAVKIAVPPAKTAKPDKAADKVAK